VSAFLSAATTKGGATILKVGGSINPPPRKVEGGGHQYNSKNTKMWKKWGCITPPSQGWTSLFPISTYETMATSRVETKEH